ncbi:putative DNA-binding domain-containing protein [Hydrogenophaga sp.]|uniref:HvfC/BufC family peptide modification chaperone n=1 Tax=Hydrogenophaga sp. TaxID=1904254 RepID=UPI003561C1A5
MSQLAAQQQALLQTLFPTAGQAPASDLLAPWLHPSFERGLAAYRSNGHALAERCLQAAYPVIHSLVGADNFAPLARHFWHHSPPVCGDMAQWGEAFAAFLASNDQLADVPYLADVARLEWALHRAASAADTTADPASLAQLGTEDPDTLGLRLASGTHTLCSAWPVASLVNAHRAADPSLAAVAELIQAGVGECAVVWRQGMRPCLGPASAAEVALIQALLHNHSLLAALNAALQADPAWDLGPWLVAAVSSGLVLAVHPLHAPAPI